MEQAGVPSEQAACSREQTGASEQAGSAVEPMECSEPTGQTEVPCVSDEREGCYEQVVLSSGSEERSPEPTISEKPAQDEEFSEPWLNHFVEQLGRVPSLWRPGMHTYSGVIKEKTARGFGYIRLMSGLEPEAEGDKKTRIVRAQTLCKRFFLALRKQLRKAAADALELNPLASPDVALRSCPIWVRRADSFLNQMPLMVAQLNAQREAKSNKKKPPPSSVAPPRLAPRPSATPPRLQAPVPPGAAGAAWVRRVVRGLRRAARRENILATSTAIKHIAVRLGTTEDRICQTWWGVRKLAMFKLRQSIARGDVPTDNGRLDAVDWAIVDMVLMYRASEMMVDEVGVISEHV
ncbi:uncharacterized protein LOC134676762 [Cydia fagiglandana]|uniref:uncharacterized protein LOC134676762 n=1 Tax=Cydia fagiglandana TaxID=1458189 RepID=UPI002FEDE936